jgi:hypothetical protein
MTVTSFGIQQFVPIKTTTATAPAIKVLSGIPSDVSASIGALGFSVSSQSTQLRDDVVVVVVVALSDAVRVVDVVVVVVVNLDVVVVALVDVVVAASVGTSLEWCHKWILVPDVALNQPSLTRSPISFRDSERFHTRTSSIIPMYASSQFSPIL